jgi:glycosyltransferase involved in cell wall biosynthesis
MPEIFERWLRFVVTRCDFVVCISAAVAEELERWITELRLQTRSGFRIRHIHLGSDLKEHTSEPPSQAISQVMARSQTVLMVGTIEPRKRHDTVLDAMEMAWQRGSNLRLVIIGKAGWNHEALIKRMRNHPSWQQYIFWLEGISDADLEYAYQHAAVFLQASAAEGFGLPIVEAARFGRPLVLSDLPVFRELAGGNATYFSVGDAAALCEILLQQDWLAGSAAAVKLKSWSESARDLRNAIENFVPDAALRKRTSDRVSLTQSIQNT